MREALLDARGHEVLHRSTPSSTSCPARRSPRSVAAFAPGLHRRDHRARATCSGAARRRSCACRGRRWRPAPDSAGTLVAVGPHGSTTPGAALRKLGVGRGGPGRVRGDAAASRRPPARGVGRHRSVAFRDGEAGAASRAGRTPRTWPPCRRLNWPAEAIGRHAITTTASTRRRSAPGAEVEASRGCPYHCTFCAKENFRDRYRRRAARGDARRGRRADRPGGRVHLLHRRDLPAQPRAAAGPGRPPGPSSACRRASTCGSPTCSTCWARPAASRSRRGWRASPREGATLLDKNCRLSTDEFAERLILAKRTRAVRPGQPDRGPAWTTPRRSRPGARTCREHGVWANEPVPALPLPRLARLRRLWGLPDDRAWERAHEHYLRLFDAFSDIQDSAPGALAGARSGMAHGLSRGRRPVAS